MSEPLVVLESVSKHYPIQAGLLKKTVGQVQAVDRVSLEIFPGETLGLVGESGCGKTTLGRMLIGLLPSNGGQLQFEGRALGDWLSLDEAQLRSKMQIIFQDPLDSLDPRYTIAQSIEEPLLNDKTLNAQQRRTRIEEMLEDVQLPKKVMNAYPHELSGGQRQRVGIARAMIVKPSFVLCDEPVSSLDLSIQVQVLHLLKDLQEKHGTAYLFISHDLAVVSAVSHRIAVMYLGSIVELADKKSLMQNPQHPYTQALLAAMPKPDPSQKELLKTLEGDPPLAHQRPSGCRFRTRCPIAESRCVHEEPPLEEKSPGHWAACHLV